MHFKTINIAKMKKIKYFLNRKLFYVFFLIATPILPAFSQDRIFDQQERQAFRFNIGYLNKYVRTEIAYETPTLWHTSLFNHKLDLKVEASLAYWHANHTPSQQHSRSSLWQIGFTPMLHWWINNNWYLEGGVGATFLSHTRFADKELSTSFQFGDHIGIVRNFGNDWRVGLRLSHFSNASIKKPNPGLNIIQLTISRSF